MKNIHLQLRNLIGQIESAMIQVMIPGYFVAKLWDCLHDLFLWIFLQLC